ncbi:MAG: dTDP-Rha--alpha-D-GlcNAc-pyrophosphate polyprenol alpha-3-L-rhamnosyltransferase [Aequorivita sp.]|nr:dTDP-Rha--alpha-D-GlcNAc-pyrophosphate polyprenol alpha-3-L-rhamnosyltransferase [Aequorivita sp.]
MRVAVVILNWNGQDLLEKFLPSVVNYSEDATVYVADNASTDNSIALVNKQFPTVKIIHNKTNGGYAKGYNDALKNLTEDLFVLLNSDVEVTKNWLQPIVEIFKNDATVVAAQPKILDDKRKEKFEYAGAAGGFLDKYGYPFCRGRIFDTLENDIGQYNDVAEIFWASGACLFVKADAFWQAGAFDEDYFAHQEEIDLCWRLQSLGGKILYVGASSIYHVGGATLANINPKKTFYNFRNSLLNLLKNVSGFKAFTAIFVRMALDAVAAFQFLIQGKPKHFIAILKAHFSFYSLIPKFLKKRKNTVKSDAYFYTKSIVFQYFIKKNRRFKNL